MDFEVWPWWVWITHSSLLAINFNLCNYSMKSFFNSHFINYKTKASHLTSWSLSFKIHKMWPLLLLLNQGLSNIDQKLNCPPSLLFQLCGFPTDPEVCVEAPGPLSSWSALFYDNLGFQIPQEQIQIDKVLKFRWTLLVVSLTASRCHIPWNLKLLST